MVFDKVIFDHVFDKWFSSRGSNFDEVIKSHFDEVITFSSKWLNCIFKDESFDKVTPSRSDLVCVGFKELHFSFKSALNHFQLLCNEKCGFNRKTNENKIDCLQNLFSKIVKYVFALRCCYTRLDCVLKKLKTEKNLLDQGRKQQIFVTFSSSSRKWDVKLFLTFCEIDAIQLFDANKYFGNNKHKNSKNKFLKICHSILVWCFPHSYQILGIKNGILMNNTKINEQNFGSYKLHRVCFILLFESGFLHFWNFMIKLKRKIVE